MSKLQAIKAFFNTPGYRPVETKELYDFVKRDREGYNEVARLCAAALGVELLD